MWESATFQTLVNQFLEIINVLVFVVFALTLLFIIWQIISAFIVNGGDAYSVEEGKKTITIAIIVLVIMVSVWGIVALLGSVFS